MPSSTVENYLKRIYLALQGTQIPPLPMGRLAKIMDVVPGTATAMVKRLAGDGLVEYEPHVGVQLTSTGEEVALSVIRRHRLVELLLVQVLGLDWSEVHDEAEALEHSVSDLVLTRIDAVLGHPSVDPHGDPIPSPDGIVEGPKAVSLADCPEGVEQSVSRILDQDPEFLLFAERSGLMPGHNAMVTSRDSASDAVVVSVGRGTSITLGSTAAKKILVKGA